MLIDLTGIKNKYIDKLFKNTKQKELIILIPHIKGELTQNLKNKLIKYIFKKLGYDIDDFEEPIININILTQNINFDYIEKIVNILINWVENNGKLYTIINRKCLFNFVSKFYPNKDEFLDNKGYKATGGLYEHHFFIINPLWYDYHSDGCLCIDYKERDYKYNMYQKLKRGNY